MKVIDMRMRPPTPEFKKQHKEHEAYIAAHYPIRAVQYAGWQNQTLEECVKEMEELDYVAVVAARSIPATTVSSDYVKKLADRYPTRFLPVGGADASPSNRRAAQDEIDRIAKVLKLKGVAIEPGFLEPPMLADDRRLYPIWAQCNDLGLFVGLQIGPYSGPTAAYSSPLQVEKIAMDFPKLQIVLFHGAYPYFEDALAMMTRFKNIWCSPDAYVRNHAWEHYMFMASGPRWTDRILYGSATPYGIGIRASLEWYQKNWKLEPAVAERYFYKNACELFGIQV